MYVSTLAKSTGHDGWLYCRYAKTTGHRYLHRDDPPTILITVLSVKIGPTSASVDLRKNWEKKCSKHSKNLGVYFGYMGGKIPTDWAQIFFGRRHPRRNHMFQIWWWSVQGFSVGWGSNFDIPHWLWRSSLQHSTNETLLSLKDDRQRFLQKVSKKCFEQFITMQTRVGSTNGWIISQNAEILKFYFSTISGICDVIKWLRLRGCALSLLLQCVYTVNSR